MAIKYRVIGSTKDLAKVLNKSERTARRIAPTIPGARRTSKGWRIPLTTREYAEARNVSIRTAERRAIRVREVTTKNIIEAERSQRGLKAYNWFKADKNVRLATEWHNPRPLPRGYPYSYTLTAHAPPNIYVSQQFVFTRRITASNLRRNRRVRKWMISVAERYGVDIEEVSVTLRGAYRQGKYTD